jgi:hypothetical protein
MGLQGAALCWEFEGEAFEKKEKAKKQKLNYIKSLEASF